MNGRLTMREVGRVLGVHHTTVSLALRNDPRLPESTRRSIQNAARAMGYTPDPMLGALSAYRRGGRPVTQHSVLAWLSCDSVPRWGPHYNWIAYLEGAQQRAAELGYRVEEFVLGAPGMTHRRMSGILRARGIQGVLIPPQPRRIAPQRIDLEWDAFSAVTFGYSLPEPKLNMVTSHHIGTAQLAVRQLHRLGYRRIGLLLERIDHERSNGGFIGGYVTEVMNDPATRPEFLIIETWDAAIIRKWLSRAKLDALIVPNTKHIDFLKTQLGISIPKALGAASLHGLGAKGYAHVRQQGERLGAAAVDQVASMIQGHQRGVPEFPLRLLIEGVWMPGNTVREITSAATKRGARCGSGAASRGSARSTR